MVPVAGGEIPVEGDVGYDNMVYVYRQCSDGLYGQEGGGSVGGGSPFLSFSIIFFFSELRRSSQ